MSNAFSSGRDNLPCMTNAKLPFLHPGSVTRVQVEVLSGKDKGKQGQVAVVARKLNQVIVQGMNTVSYSCLPNLAGMACMYLMYILWREVCFSRSLC